ncbi:hypothetical protein [Pseudomonas huaxiensis]|uniref:hypothetical protein n=1 Tax=Pseudomonas huaxiensis TaxID=2213017 RepID=UPI000DA679A4|nr:hypothetical protein [Pseudomonas huaxiensis]
MNDMDKLSPELVQLKVLKARTEADKRAQKARFEASQRSGVFNLVNNEVPTLDPPTLLNALPDEDDDQPNTIPIDQAVKVEVLEWDGMPNRPHEIAFRFNDGDYGEPQDILPGFGKVELEVPVSALSHGAYQLSYRTRDKPFLNPTYSFSVPFFIDKVDPNEGSQPAAAELPDDLPAGNRITPEYLTTHGGVTVKIPTLRAHKPGDRYDFYINTDLIIADVLLEDPFEVTIARSFFDALPGGELQFTYNVVDRAGNRTNLSIPDDVYLVKNPAPTLVNAPEIPEGPTISLAQARDGVDLYHDYVTPISGDFVNFYWNSVNLESISHPEEYKTISFKEISDLGREYDAEVTYDVTRGGVTYPSPPTTVRVDLTQVGPPNPDEPDIINPDLEELTLESFTGESDAIVPEDKGQDATITVQVYDQAQAGEFIKVYYGGTVVGVRELSAADITTGSITMPLPWAMIEANGNGNIPAHYSIYADGLESNAQESPPTNIVVTVNLIEDLPLVVFSNRDPVSDTINCSVEPWIKGVDIQMSYPGFEPDDALEIHWVMDTDLIMPGDPGFPANPVEATRRVFEHTVTVAEAAVRVVTFNVPWGDGEHIDPVPIGSIVVFWKLTRDGGATSGTSSPHYVLIGRFYSDGTVCPRP